jgi:hypothetical protein
MPLKPLLDTPCIAPPPPPPPEDADDTSAAPPTPPVRDTTATATATPGLAPVAPPPRTAATALTEARAHAITAQGHPGTLGGTVIDYADVRTPATLETSAQLAHDVPLVAHARSQLSTHDQRRLDQLREELSHDPRAQLALDVLLLDGRLPGAPALRGTDTESGPLPPQDLLGQLLLLAYAPAVEGLHAAPTLLGVMVKELAYPEAIRQGDKGTCTVTACAVALARARPAELVRVVMALASPAGEVELASGATLVREPDTVGDDGSGRTVTQRLLAPALMELGNGLLPYDNAEDRTLLTGSGLDGGEQACVAEALFGRPFERVCWASAAELADLLAHSGAPVILSLRFPTPDARHALLLTEISRDADGVFVRLQNPWGQEVRVSLEVLYAHARSAVRPGR